MDPPFPSPLSPSTPPSTPPPPRRRRRRREERREKQRRPKPSATIEPLSFHVGVPSTPYSVAAEGGGDEAEEDDFGLPEAPDFPPGLFGAEDPQGREPGDTAEGRRWPMEDGTLAPSRPLRYGEEWAQALFSFEDILESDPDYQFLALVAGAANTEVQNLYKKPSVRALVQEANQAVQETLQTRDTLRALWGPYQQWRRLWLDFTSKPEGNTASSTQRRLRTATRNALTAAHLYRLEEIPRVVRSYVLLAAPTGELAEAEVGAAGIDTERFLLLADLTAESMSWLHEADDFEDEGETTEGASPRQGFLSTVMARWGGPEDIGPQLEGLVDSVLEKPEAGGEAAGVDEEEEDTLTDVENAAMLESAFVLMSLYLSWMVVQKLPDRPGYLQVDEEGRIRLTFAPPMSPGVPGGRRTDHGGSPKRPLEIWRERASNVLRDWYDQLTPIPGVTVLQAIIRAVDAGVAFYGSDYSTQLRDLAAGYQQSFRIAATATRDLLAWVAEWVRDAVAQALDTTPRDVEAMGDLKRVLDRTDWDPAFRNWLGDVVRDLGTLEEQWRALEAESLGYERRFRGIRHNPMDILKDGRDTKITDLVEEELRAKWKTLRRKARDMETQIEQLMRTEGGGRSKNNNNNGNNNTRSSLGIRHRQISARWALHPRFTGRIQLAARTVAAINNAFTEVAQRLPGLSPPSISVERRHRVLKHTPLLSQLYANLVANFLEFSAIRFPKQWHLESAYDRAMQGRVDALLALSTWLWGGSDGAYNTGKVNAAATSLDRIIGSAGIGRPPALEDPALIRHPWDSPPPSPDRLTWPASPQHQGTKRHRSGRSSQQGPQDPSGGGSSMAASALFRPAKRSRYDQRSQTKQAVSQQQRRVQDIIMWSQSDIRAEVFAALRRHLEQQQQQQ